MANAKMNGQVSSPSLVLDGDSLTVEDIFHAVDNPRLNVAIADSSLAATAEARDFLDQEMGRRIIYGVNTGFGPMASRIIGREQLRGLQGNLIRSHATGMGKPIDKDYVLAAMVVRLNTLAKGFSGVSVDLLDHLRTFINQRIIPVIPEHGGVGASGDLVQLAHIALALMGEGKVVYRDRLQPVAKMLKELGIEPYQFQPKEGLSMINGTSVMTGMAALLCVHARRLLGVAIRTGALALEVVQAFDDGISQELQRLRPHRGQVAVAGILRELLSSSRLLRKRESSLQEVHMAEDVHEISRAVQEVYSLRCIPQILGPVFDTLEQTQQVVEIELNSVTDNPIVDWKRGDFLHGGNFHGDYVAAAVDHLKMALVKLTMLSERRINFFLNAPVNGHFPPFMNLQKPGLDLALQGLQFVATSTAAHSQTLAFPHYIHSIPTNADNQDVVSMGTDATLIAMEVVENAYIVLAIELVTLAQAVDFLGVKEKLATASVEIFERVRAVVPPIKNDRAIANELQQVVHFIKRSRFINLTWPPSKAKSTN